MLLNQLSLKGLQYKREISYHHTELVGRSGNQEILDMIGFR